MDFDLSKNIMNIVITNGDINIDDEIKSRTFGVKKSESVLTSYNISVDTSNKNVVLEKIGRDIYLIGPRLISYLTQYNNMFDFVMTFDDEEYNKSNYPIYLYSKVVNGTADKIDFIGYKLFAVTSIDVDNLIISTALQTKQFLSSNNTNIYLSSGAYLGLRFKVESVNYNSSLSANVGIRDEFALSQLSEVEANDIVYSFFNINRFKGNIYSYDKLNVVPEVSLNSFLLYNDSFGVHVGLDCILGTNFNAKLPISGIFDTVLKAFLGVNLNSNSLKLYPEVEALENNNYDLLASVGINFMRIMDLVDIGVGYKRRHNSTDHTNKFSLLMEIGH